MGDPLTLAEQVAALRRTLRRAVTTHLAGKTERPFVQLLALKVVGSGEVKSQAALAERLQVDPPAASRVVAQLVEDGLLLKSEGKDRRCFCLELTADGRREVRKLQDALASLDAQVRETLSPSEYEAMQRQVERLTQALAGDQ